MSLIAMQGGATGTGTVTLLAPVTSTNRTLTLPDATGTVLTTATAGVPIGGPAFSAYANATLSVTAGTATKVLFQTKEFDTNNNFASSTFTPTVAGYYNITAYFAISGAAATGQVRIYKNGSLFKFTTINTTANQVGGTVLIYCNGSTDYIEVYAFISASVTLIADQAQTYFQAALVRSAT